MIRLAIVIGALFCGAAHAEAPLSRTAGGLPTALVRVGSGAPAPFIIATGAAQCSVTPAFAADRKLAMLGDGTATPRALVPAMTLDNQRVGPLTCAVEERADASGVVGADMLARFVAVVDLRAMTLSLHGAAQRGQRLVGPQAKLLRGEVRDGRSWAPVRLNSVPGQALIDTGVAATAVSGQFAGAAGVKPSASRLLGALELAGRTDQAFSAPVTDPADPPAGRPTMVLGMDRLAGWRIVLDTPRQRVWFDPG